jgi:geranylgeranyl diphosphate synthase type I
MPRPVRDPARAREAFKTLLSTTKPAVERRMRELFAGRLKARGGVAPEVKTVVEVARDLTLRGGKRFRAALLASTYFGAKPRGAQDVAIAGGVALEMLQSYLLIQDDWMDGDVERRGGPSAHVALAKRLGKGPLVPERAGAVGAILAGDLVWGLAIESLATAGAPANVRADAVAELVAIHEDVAIGQVLDTVAKKADTETLHDLKTGSYTVRGPLALGAILGGAPRSTVRALGSFAAPLGVAFQLRDDLLGVFGTEEESGRPAGSDLMAGKGTTSVLKYALPRLRGADKRAVSAVWRRRASKTAVAAAVSAVEGSGARDVVEKRLAALCTEAESKADKLPLSEKARFELAGASLAIRVGPGGREAR